MEMDIQYRQTIVLRCLTKRLNLNQVINIQENLFPFVIIPDIKVILDPSTGMFYGLLCHKQPPHHEQDCPGQPHPSGAMQFNRTCTPFNRHFKTISRPMYRTPA